MVIGAEERVFVQLLNLLTRRELDPETPRQAE
jgi:hypothetical protein